MTERRAVDRLVLGPVCSSRPGFHILFLFFLRLPRPLRLGGAVAGGEGGGDPQVSLVSSSSAPSSLLVAITSKGLREVSSRELGVCLAARV